ncbi:MAG: terminase family protein [Alphaproteobacteria bacterium]|nr:terminase family protein [Alphaproteobacteria bacterium]
MPVFYPYQSKWVKDKKRHKIGMFSRQSGKTFTTTFEAAKDCVDAELLNEKRRWIILSRGQRQAEEAMREGVQVHLAAMKRGFEAVDYSFSSGITAHEVRFAGGSRITALPASPDTARGFAASVMLDEFAFHQDSREIWKALYPVISAGHKIRVISTPNGKNNKFYELMTGQDSTWSRHTCDIYQAVADGLPRNIDELRAGIGDPEAWAQEYELQFIDGAGSWLTFDIISQCEMPDAGKPALYGGGLCFVGWDIARRRDLTVFWVIEQVGNLLITREICEMPRASFEEQEAKLADIMAQYKVVRLAADQTGMGEYPVERAKAKYGDVVEGVLFSPASKLLIATAFKAVFEDRRIAIPNRPELRADLHSVKAVTGSTNAPRLVADRDGGSHADRFWAGALAAAAASEPVQEYEFLPAYAQRNRNRPDFDDDDRQNGGGLTFLGAQGRRAWQ